MKTKEVYVKSRRATAVTSMKKIGDKIYLGLTGGSETLAVLDTNTDEITLCNDVFPWVKNRNYCVKIKRRNQLFLICWISSFIYLFSKFIQS